MSGVAVVLAAPAWQQRRAAHEARVDAWTQGHLERRLRGQRNPVEDFLFDYYSQRPAQLRRWSPGPGVVLADAPVQAPWVEAPEGAVLDDPPARVVEQAQRTVALLGGVEARPMSFGCFGLHEWAMVLGRSAQEVRHPEWPLRLGESGVRDVLAENPLACTHFDAFRFFTDEARPRNPLQLTRANQAEHEQGGCLHAGMDLYKWAFRLSPWVEAELVADCFDLARRIRVLDMRASPYDLTALGLVPVAVETPAGKAEYADGQRAFAAEAAPLRRRVLDAARGLAPGVG